MPDAGPPPRVDFYILGEGSATSPALLACKLGERAWRAGYRVLIVCADAEGCGQVDQLLWTFRDEAFVPHAQAPAHDPLDPIVIGTDEAGLAAEFGFRIRLDPQAPCTPPTGRIAEIVAGDPGARDRGRERFRWYRQHGIEPGSHRID